MLKFLKETLINSLGVVLITPIHIIFFENISTFLVWIFAS